MKRVSTYFNSYTVETKKHDRNKVVMNKSIMETIVYNQEGKEVGKVTLPEKVFGVPWKADLVHQVATSMMTSVRRGTAHTKDRSEVSGGGKKPWRQKGTGRARHGSTRSPIWVGGGVAHGPRNDQNFFRKINKKAKYGAFCALLSRKFKEGEVLFVDRIELREPKTKEAKKVLVNLSAVKGFDGLAAKKQNAAVVAVEKRDVSLDRSFKNIGNISLEEVRNLNPLCLLQYKYVIIANPSVSLPILNRASA